MDSPERRNPRILLVEDDPVDRKAVERLFAREALPYELMCAGTVAEAVEIHREHRPDLVLIDYCLPDGTGLELQALLEGTSCVFITGEKDISVAIQAMKSGALDFLEKDTERTYVELLPLVIDRAFEVHRLREEVRRHTEELDELVIARTGELEAANERLRQEITERKRAEEALRESEDKLIGAQRIAKLGHYSLDIKTGRWTSSAELDDVFGIDGNYTRDVDGWLQLVHPESRETIAVYLQDDVLTRHKEFDKEYKIIDQQTGQGKWVHGLGSLVYDDNDDPVTMLGTIQDITERKRAEREIWAIRDRLELSIERMPVGYILWDTKGKVTYWNPAAERIFGFTSEEAVGRTLLGLVVPKEVRPAVAGVLQRLVAGEADSYSEPGNNLRKDGSVISCQWFNTPLIEATGEVSGVLSMVLDVTERRLAEAELRRSEAIVASSTDMLALLDRKFTYLAANPASLKAFGKTHDQVVGHTVAEVLGEEFFNRVLRPNAERCLGGAEVHFQEWFDFPASGKAYMDVSYHPYVGADNKVRGFVVNARDITDRKRAEDELRLREQQLSLIYDSTGDILYYLGVEPGPHYRFLTVNSAFLKATGLTVEQVVGKTVNEVIPETSLQLVRSNYEKAIREKRIAYWEETSQYPTGLKTGVVSIAPVFDDEGNCTHLVGSVHDITERKLAEDEIRALNVSLEHRVAGRTAELEAANKELEAFSYSVSHDLKAPLRAIDGYSGKLEEELGERLDPEGRRLLDVVRQRAQHMSRLIDDLLAFSRLGRAELRITEVDMGKLAQTTFTELAAAHAGREIEFTVGDLPTARADFDLIGQVWANLLDNAIKFTGQREVARIEVGYREEADRHVFFVQDNGAGFDMEYVDKLFGVFQRLHYDDEFPGTGVGLANVRRIVERHGGDVRAEGEVDQGATIFFRLPRTERTT